MLFSFEKKGNPAGFEIIIPLDRIHDTAYENLGKILEPHFQVTYIRLPEPAYWVTPDPMPLFRTHFREEIFPIWEKKPLGSGAKKEDKALILNGFSSGFWMEFFRSLVPSLRKVVLLNPELHFLTLWNRLRLLAGSEIDRKNPLAWIQNQPIFFHLTNFSEPIRSSLPFPCPCHLIRPQSSLGDHLKISRQLRDIYPRSESSSFSQETWESLIYSKTLKKLLLKGLAEDFHLKPETIEPDLWRIGTI